MITIQFLAEWAIRSSVLILCGALLLRAFRVKDPSIRLAAGTALLCGSLAIPFLIAAAPRITTPALPAVASPASLWAVATATPIVTQTKTAPSPFDWSRIALAVYFFIAASLLLRLCVGHAMSRRLLRRTRPAGRLTDGIEIRESDDVAAPVATGIVRPVIVLPAEWNRWETVKLEAVLAHERSHIRRRDPAIQLLSAIHCALAWHSPLSWVLHRAIVRTAEEASDDAALTAACDRVSYAEILMDFMRRGANDRSWQGVAMARYAPPEKRIHRILDGTVLSRGVTRWSVALILMLGLPLAYVIAAAHPEQSATPAPPAAPRLNAAPALPDAPEPPQAPATPAAPAVPAAPQGKRTVERYIVAFGDNSISGSWNSNDRTNPETLRAKYGRTFAWFLRDGHEFVVTDAGVMAEFEKAMEPQNEVNRLQNGVNAEQSRVNTMQEVVNAKQNEVNASQAQVNQRQEHVNRIQEALLHGGPATDDDLRGAKEGVSQDAVNGRQSDVNRQQALVNAEQNKVNAMQNKVNGQQHRVSAEYDRKFEEIFDSATRRGLARQIN